MIPGQAFYNRLPVWAQTLAVNFASARGVRTKYGAEFHEQLAQLELNERLPRDQWRAAQQTAVRALLVYARQHVPYYRELDCPADNLAAWPILDKQAVQAAPEQFVSDEFDRRRLLRLPSSGTTGAPLTVWVTRAYHQMEMAFRWRHKAWGGVPYLRRGAYVAGHPVVPPTQSRPPFWRIDRVEKRLLCSSYHLTRPNLPFYMEALTQYAPDFVQGYPSALYVLAQHMLTHGVKHIQPQAVFSAGETLLEFQRGAIEKAFGTKVYNWYGSRELTGNIIECPAGKLHARPDYGLLELLEDGTMVCTGLNNRAMPFIRYRVGDVASWGDAECPCGCTFPVVDRIEGRLEDYVRTPDGRLVGRLDYLFKGVAHVREAQIVQRQLDELVLRVVRDRGYGPADEHAIVAEGQQRLGDSARLRFEYVDQIERGANGKFRFMVSELPAEVKQISLRAND